MRTILPVRWSSRTMAIAFPDRCKLMLGFSQGTIGRHGQPRSIRPAISEFAESCFYSIRNLRFPADFGFQLLQNRAYR